VSAIRHYPALNQLPDNAGKRRGRLEVQIILFPLAIISELIQQLTRDHNVIVHKYPAPLVQFNRFELFPMGYRTYPGCLPTAVFSPNDSKKSITFFHGAKTIIEVAEI